ncbi:hypothetical protein VIGAN_08189700 [Vigna angularis var. angularis]|uniref:Uncharacterized protein n=1 Tax=Vigna angularis var. angularis TaxID=157739 RepID=A0A0S3SQW3_PHAAN|nr:hypothetical protein VIGAN_08189700 [Vigna angularis var. angularis]
MSLIFHQNIEKAHKYKVVFFAKASGAVDLHVPFVGSDNTELASNNIGSFGHNVTEWTRMETVLEAKATNHNASLQITTSKKGVLWLDQVSAMPLDTFKIEVALRATNPRGIAGALKAGNPTRFCLNYNELVT